MRDVWEGSLEGAIVEGQGGSRNLVVFTAPSRPYEWALRHWSLMHQNYVHWLSYFIRTQWNPQYYSFVFNSWKFLCSLTAKILVVVRGGFFSVSITFYAFVHQKDTRKFQPLHMFFCNESESVLRSSQVQKAIWRWEEIISGDDPSIGQAAITRWYHQH